MVGLQSHVDMPEYDKSQIYLLANHHGALGLPAVSQAQQGKPHSAHRTGPDRVILARAITWEILDPNTLTIQARSRCLLSRQDPNTGPGVIRVFGFTVPLAGRPTHITHLDPRCHWYRPQAESITSVGA